jgi:phosphate transport system substrate-binding protein
MTMTPGCCRNTDYCAAATTGRRIEVAVGKPFVCPECGKPLAPPAGTASGRGGLLVGVAAITLVVGVGVTAYALLGHAGGPSPAQAATAQATPAPQAPDLAAPPAAIATAAAAPAQRVPVKPHDVAVTQAMSTTPATPTPTAPNPAPPAMPAAGDLVLLRIDGATAIQSQLGPRLAEAYLNSVGDTDISQTRDPSGHTMIITGMRGSAREDIVINSYSATHGFQTLGAGTSDIAMSTRRIKPAERVALQDLGDMTSAASEHVMALDGIAVIVNPANPVAQLDVTQLRAIFTGALSEWSQLGGAGGPVSPWARNKDSGTYDTFADLVMSGSPLAPGAHSSDDDSAIAATVAHDPGAIGFVSQAHIGNAKAIAIAATGGVPVKPTAFTLSTEDYPFTRRLYLYTANRPKNPFVARFAEFTQSPTGQAVVEQTGFVPLTVKQAMVTAPVTAPSKYRQLVSGAKRLSVDFRFLPGSTDLDNRSARDFRRVLTVLSSSHIPGGNLVLCGFADAQGTPELNMELAKRRADAVAGLFRNAGVKPGRVEAFGADIPIADNATPEGREKNRRVEVYLRSNT